MNYLTEPKPDAKIISEKPIKSQPKLNKTKFTNTTVLKNAWNKFHAIIFNIHFSPHMLELYVASFCCFSLSPGVIKSVLISAKYAVKDQVKYSLSRFYRSSLSKFQAI